MCEYCKRPLEATTSGTELAACREHIEPRHRRGRKRVWACKKCDLLKGDMAEILWRKFMAENPRWWEGEGKKGWKWEYGHWRLTILK